MPTDADVTTSLVRRFYDRLWNAWDDVAVDETLAPDFVFRGSLGEQTTGRDGWRAYRDQVRRAAPDFSNEIVELVAVADRAAARLLYSGTHRGSLLGIEATERCFTYSGAAFFTVADGLLREAWVLGDLDRLRRQLS